MRGLDPGAADRPATRLPMLALGLAVALVLAGCAGDRPGFTPPGILFVPTPDDVGTEMLRLAGVTSSDVVYDLGSGDGRLVIAAARQFGARAVGIELAPDLVQSSRERAATTGVADRTRFIWQDIFAADVGEATVVTLYLGEAINARLRPKLLAELRPGARIVSHRFAMGDWTPDRTVTARGPGGEHPLHLWLVPADAAGRWRLTLAGRPASLTLVQRYQSITGAVEWPDRLDVAGRLAGDRIRLAGGELALEGRVRGDRMTGRATVRGAPAGEWTAERAR